MFNNSNRANIGILGAGIMGCCLALEIARRGHIVDLIDLAPTPMTGASLHNEGKLHLGFVYAKDPLKKTHTLMMKGSLAFSHIIKKLTMCSSDKLIPSLPFHYFVPVDSQMDMKAIDNHFQDVEKKIFEETQSTGHLYLDRTIKQYFKRNSASNHSRMFSTKSTHGSYRTEECSVSTIAVANILCQAVKNHPGINFIGNTEVISADRLTSGDVEIETRTNRKLLLTRYPCVANCLWDDRLRVDSTAGINDQGPWLLRYKATITITNPAAAHKAIPSATGILGPYGDIVNHNNGSYYISWYPLCKLAQSIDENGRKLHDMAHKWILPRYIKKILSGYPSISKFVSSITHRKFIRDNVREMANYIPLIANLINCKNSCKVGGGVIMARGNTDIDDPSSYLHQRSAIGPVAYGSYLTIDSGKYCTAPLFALEAADLIKDIL